VDGRHEVWVEAAVRPGERIDDLAARPSGGEWLLLKQAYLLDQSVAVLQRESPHSGERGIPAHRVPDCHHRFDVIRRGAQVEKGGEEDERRRVGRQQMDLRVEALGSVELQQGREVVAPAQRLDALDQRIIGRQRAEAGGGVRAAAGKNEGSSLHAGVRVGTDCSAAARIWSRPTRTAEVAVPSGTNESTARTDAMWGPAPCSARSAMIASATPPPVARHSSTTSTAAARSASER